MLTYAPTSLKKLALAAVARVKPVKMRMSTPMIRVNYLSYLYYLSHLVKSIVVF